MSKNSWRKVIRDVTVTLVTVGILIGLYFASLTGPGQNFDWSVFFTYIFFLIVVGAILIYVYWSIKTKRETRSPKKIKTIETIRMKDLITQEEHILEEKVKPLLNNISVINLKDSDSLIPRVTFEFHKDHKYNFLYNLSIEVLSPTNIKMSAILRTEYPISLSIKRKSHNQTEEKVNKEIRSSQYFNYHSSHPIAFEEIFTDKKFDEKIISLKDTLTSLAFNGKFAVAIISNYMAIDPIFKIITFIHDQLMLKDFSNIDVEKLICYQCGDVFEANEEKCNKCGAPRPRCVVCLLDTKPSEKKKVIQTPCCGVYAHKEHLISWLETNPRCPNCKKDLFLLLRTFKQGN